MTEQYLPNSINGQPATLSLSATPQAVDAIAFGAVNTSALLFPDSQLESGPGFTVTNDANAGTSIQFLAPGVYNVSLSVAAAAPGLINFLLNRTDANDITAGNGYPAADFTAVVGGGVVAIAEATAPGFVTLSAQVTITSTDIDPLPNGDANPASILIIAATPAVAPVNVSTALSITRLGAAG